MSGRVGLVPKAEVEADSRRYCRRAPSGCGIRSWQVDKDTFSACSARCTAVLNDPYLPSGATPAHELNQRQLHGHRITVNAGHCVESSRIDPRGVSGACFCEFPGA